MSRSAIVAGVGMTKFAKPGQNEPYPNMAASAIRDALQDAGIGYDAVGQAYAGYVYGDSASGQRSLYEVGMTGIPVVNVNNNCSTGSTALFLARQAVENGSVDVALAFGFEQMQPGAIGELWKDRPGPLGNFDRRTDVLVGHGDVPLALRYFAGAGKAHMEKFGSTLEDYASVRAKASRHAANNPLALFRNVVSVEDVLNSQVIMPGVLTRLMACPPTCGAAAAILVSEDYARRHGLNSKVKIIAQSMTTDTPDTFGVDDMRYIVGYGMTAKAAGEVYEQAGVGPQDIDVLELHDCFAQNELITYEGLGLCPEGDAPKFIADGDNTYGGAVVTNPSGGLLSKGHPLGATGLAQCYELTRQIRGTADATQVEGARTALQHNLGLGGACVITIYQANN